MVESLFGRGLIKKRGLALEGIADEMANTIAQKQKVPTIVNGFPIWSSPLYAPDPSSSRLLRGRMYLPGQNGGFEIGTQENDYDRFMARLARQRENWNISQDDSRMGESDLASLISGGLPPMFGFALSPDRIVKIWCEDCTIDPYRG
jgi:lysyl-tRNA synthetase class II